MPRSFEVPSLPRRALSSLVVCGTTGAMVLGLAPGAAAASDVVQQTLDVPRFVQEGMPVDVGGQAVPWDAGLGLKVIGDTDYAWELPPGVTHTAISTGALDNADLTLILRSDGQVVATLDDFWKSAPAIPDLPDGVHYTAVAAGTTGASFLLRSDGMLVTVEEEGIPVPEVPRLPAGMSYTAVDAGDDSAYAVRSDGRLVAITPWWAGTQPPPCADALVPPAGLGYTAISADGASWAALRSDGAVVYCRWNNNIAAVIAPLEGTRYTGIDIAPGLGGNRTMSYGYAARDDGKIVGFGSAPVPAAVPSGRIVVGLSAHGRGGTALLDDGTLLTWGPGHSAPLPGLPGDPGFAAVSSWYETKWLIRRGATIPVDLQVESPTTVNYNEPTPVEISVTAGGLSPTGWIRIGYVRDDGSMWWGFPERVVDGRATFEFRDFPEGVHPRVVRFDGPPFATTEKSVDFVVRPQQPSTITVDMPAKWRVGAGDVYVGTHVEASGGVSTDQGYFTVTAEESGERLGAGTHDGRAHIDTTVLPPGRHQVRVDYVSDGPAAPASWTGTVTVVPPAETLITVDTELTAEYGSYSTHLDADMTVRTVDGSRLPLGYLYVYDEDGNSLYSAGGTSSQGAGLIEYSTSLRLDGMPPGDHPVLVRWVPDKDLDTSNPTTEVLPAEWRGSIRITKASTRILTDPLAAGVYGQDSSMDVGVAATNLAEVHGTILAKIDGVEVGRAEIAADPPEAPVVSVPIRMSGVLPGAHRLEISYLGSELLKPASAAWQLEVRPAEFTTPNPTVSGTAQVGKTLTALRGPWTPSPSTTKYQWRLDGRSVSGATGQTWKVPAAARGKKVTVAITGSKTGYITKTLVSPSTLAVKAGVFVAPTPRITGTPRVGATLQVLRGVWTPQPSSVKYQWKVAGRPVAGATRSTFTVPSSARGKRVAVVVTGSLAGYTTKSVSQSMTSLIR